MAHVYFTKEISSNSLVNIFKTVNKNLDGNIGIKISTGELGGHNYLKPELIKEIVDYLKGTIIECNTAYTGNRNTTEAHKNTIKEHGFYDIAKVDIMDEFGEMNIPVTNGIHIKNNIVGKNLDNYNSLLMLSHFKGHAMGGFGGALKNMSIGIASSNGKANIHTAGKTNKKEELWNNLPDQNDFLEAMAEADKSVMEYMNNNIVYINVINNISIDCDCDSNPEAPCISDIGIVASTDPVAIDKASLDLIYNSQDNGKERLINRIEEKNGIHLVEYAEKLNLGTTNYQLVNIDE